MRRIILGVSLILMLLHALGSAFNGQQPAFAELTATVWEETYGGSSQDVAYSIAETADGGYAIAGYTMSSGAGSYDFWVVKVDVDGDMRWNKTYGGSSWDWASSIAQVNDEGFVVGGFTGSFGHGSFDFWLVKTDSEGAMEWNKTYGGMEQELARAMIETDDGGYALAGHTRSFGAGDFDFYLVKTDVEGNMQWNKTYGGENVEDATSIVQTSDKGYLIAGLTESFGVAWRDVFVVKTDSAGNMLWNKTYGGSRDDVASSVVPTADGGYLIAGATSSFHHSSEIWLVKVDSLGNLQWDKTYGGEDTDTPISMIPAHDGGYALAGRTRSFGAGGEDIWVVKTDPRGAVEWNQTFGGALDDQARSIIQTVDGTYVVAGWTESFGAGLSDVYVVRFSGPAAPGFQSFFIILLLIAGTLVALVVFMGHRKPAPKQAKPAVSQS